MRHPEMQTRLLLFDDVHRAEQAADLVRHLRQARQTTIGGASLLHRDADGTLHIDEFDDLTPMQGVAGGLLLGLVVGAFFSPTVLNAAISAAFAGLLIGRYIDRGINDADLERVAHLVPPRQSGLLLVALPTHLDAIMLHVRGQIAQHDVLMTPDVSDPPRLPGSDPQPGVSPTPPPSTPAPQR